MASCFFFAVGVLVPFCSRLVYLLGSFVIYINLLFIDQKKKKNAMPHALLHTIRGLSAQIIGLGAQAECFAPKSCWLS